MLTTCEHCGTEFQAVRRTARFCSNTCRSRARRARHGNAAGVDDSDSDLVVQVKADLEAAGRLDSFAGRLAVQLARNLSASDATGVAGLSKELRTVMAAALEGSQPAPGEPAADAPDAVDMMKERRDRKAREAAARLA